MIARLQHVKSMLVRFAAISLWLVATSGAQAQTVRYIHTDGLGSVVLVTDKYRNVVERREYEPYGAALTGVKDGPGYAGHVSDAQTGLTYMQQRYYDSICGRFLSVDPVTAHGNGDWRLFNRYAYAFNNPYKFTDPDGRASWYVFSDAFRVEVSAGLQLEAKAKLTNAVQLGAGLGSVSLGGGVSGAMDGYTFEEGNGPSAGVVIADKVQVGWTPSRMRSEQGRYNIPFTEHAEKGSFAIGLKKNYGGIGSKTQIAPSPTEFSAKISLILGVELKIDIGQAAYGLFEAKPGEKPAQEIQGKQQWEQYKKDFQF